MVTRTLIRWVASIVLGLLARGAAAQPKLVYGDDPDAADVRKAVTEFYTKLGAADAAGAKAASDLTGDDAKELAAYLAAVRASNDTKKALLDKFGDDAEGHPLASVTLGDMIAATPAQLDDRIFVLTPDGASVASPGSVFGHGMRLRKAGGKWRVTHLTSGPPAEPGRDAAAGVVRDMYAGVAADVKSGKVRRLADLEAAFEPWNKKLTETMTAAAARVGTRVSPPPAAGKWDAPPAESLQSLIDKEISSPEAGKVIGALPGVPGVQAGPGTMTLVSVEGGVMLVFDAETAKIRGATVTAPGYSGLAGFAGALPRGVKFDMPRGEVEALLGRPSESSGGNEASRLTTRYPRLGIDLTYDNHLRDPKSPLTAVRLFEPEPAAPEPARADAPPPKGRLAFRLVAADAKGEPVDMLADPADPTGERKLAVERAVRLDESHVAEIGLTLAAGDRAAVDRLAIGLTMTPDGARALEKLSAANVGRQLAIVLDGALLTAPTIRSKISDRIIITPGRRQDAGTTTALADRMHATLSALPVSGK